jgi:hypothetical protein
MHWGLPQTTAAFEFVSESRYPRVVFEKTSKSRR